MLLVKPIPGCDRRVQGLGTYSLRHANPIYLGLVCEPLALMVHSECINPLHASEMVYFFSHLCALDSGDFLELATLSCFMARWRP